MAGALFLTLLAASIGSAAAGDCRGPKKWGSHTMCLSSDDGGRYDYYCPWQTAIVVGSARFGQNGNSCSAFQIKCDEIDAQGVIDHYENSDPKEGATAAMVKYTTCCIRHQCYKEKSCGTGASACEGTHKPKHSGDVAACMSADKGNTWVYHCPWESAKVVATKNWGGCSGVQYDCADKGLKDVMDLYKKHDEHDEEHPDEETNKAEVKYAECCIRKQCYPAEYYKGMCGDAPARFFLMLQIAVGSATGATVVLALVAMAIVGSALVAVHMRLRRMRTVALEEEDEELE